MSDFNDIIKLVFIMANEVIKSEIEKINNFDIIYYGIFNNNDYLEYDDVYSKIFPIFPQKLKFRLSYIFSWFQYRFYESRYYSTKNSLDKIKDKIDEHNKDVIAREIQNFKNICGIVEGNYLDDNQIDSIVRKNKNQLVLAGAGSGKTTTIVGKVKYLLATGKYNPNDILLLSFTNASASEMSERIKKETGIDLDVFTFHKLGLDIIKKSAQKNVNVFDKDLYPIIKEMINENINDSDYLNRLVYFLSTVRFDVRDEFDFSSEKEYCEYLQTNKPKTINNEIVKSYGELEIANYLYKNNIEYIYENEYEYDTTTEEYRQYKPDFYLPKYKIYIEYFGIDENNEVAPFFKEKNGISATQAYNEEIEWKRNLHKSNNTTMVESYYYEKKQGILIEKLEEKLKNYGVQFIQKSDEELWSTINNNNKGLLYELCRVFQTIIGLIKSNNYTIDYLYNVSEVINSRVNLITLDLLKPIYQVYQKKLQEASMIDFNDMINLATSYLEQNMYIHSYKYIIVDEYQDISNSRYRLLKAMRNQNDYGLFCVGDDWQSIYRFNGSDIDLITNFDKYWGATYVSCIDTTYRFTSMMSKLSGNFIMRNPRQYRKNLNAKISEELAIEFINGYTQSKCIDFLADKLYKLEKNSTIFLLGRYSFDIDMFKNNNDFQLRYNNVENVTDVIYLKRRDLNIKFLTIHKSKGLQADYVVIVNNKEYGMGFPNKINDLPIIKILLAGGLDEYPYSEERRLFYVALTRSKKKTFLLTIDNNKSSFVNEIRNDYDVLMKYDSELKQSIYRCPQCGGRLVKRKNKYGYFMGCSNYPNCKYLKDI